MRLKVSTNLDLVVTNLFVTFYGDGANNSLLQGWFERLSQGKNLL